MAACWRDLPGLPVILTNVATLISGGFSELVKK